MRTIPFSSETNGHTPPENSHPRMLTVPDGIEAVDGFLGVTPDGMILFEDQDLFEEKSDATWLDECHFIPPVQSLLSDGEECLLGAVANLRYRPRQSKTMLVTRNDVDIGHYNAECVRRYSVDQLTLDERKRYRDWAETGSAPRDELLGVAYQRTSSNFGIGGRIITIPPVEKLEQSLTPGQVAEAGLYLYILQRRREMLELLHRERSEEAQATEGQAVHAS